MTPQTPQTPGSAAALDTVNRAAAAQSKAYDVYYAAKSALDEAQDVCYASAWSLDSAKEDSRNALAAYRAALDSDGAKGGVA